MIANITSYFDSLNNAGQALFIVGVLLVITFIVLLIIVLKPEKNNIKKIYGESPLTDKENAFEEKMKDIDNVSDNDINIDNDKTRNLKYIVDELKHLEAKSSESVMDRIERYEDEQEDTAIISVEELLKSNKPVTYAKRADKVVEAPVQEFVKPTIENQYQEKVTPVHQEVKEEVKYTPRKEVFSSVFAETNENENQEFLKSLKEFRNNL